MPTKLNDIYWLAGILEGEGSFNTPGNGKSPTIKLKMTDLDIIEKVRNIVDPFKHGAITLEHRVGAKTAYIITLNGNNAAQWMMTIYSLMGLRRKTRIRELLHTWKSIRSRVNEHEKIIQILMIHKKMTRVEAENYYLEILVKE